MVEEAKKMHYAWLIFIGCCCLAAGTMALTLSIIGVYLLPASKSLGVGPGDFAMWATVSGFVSVVSMPFWGQFLPTKTKLCTTLGAVLLIVGVLLFGYGPSLPFIIAGGVCVGAALPVMFTVTIPTLMGNWFAQKQRGKFLGIAMAFSGVGTFIWAPVFTMIVQNAGLQTAYTVNAILIAVLTLPFTLFVFKYSPEEKGLKPFGYDKNANVEEGSKSLKEGMPSGKAFATVAFWCMLFVIGLTSIGMGFNSNQPAIATELMAASMDPKSAAMLGATMISTAAVGNIIGKILYGWICDKIGVRVTTWIFLVATILCFVIWLVVPSMPTLLVGAFLLGTHNGVYSVGYPLIVRALFGNKDYSKIYSRLSMAGALVGGSATAIVGYVYQITGSYSGALVGGIVLFLVIAVLVTIAMSFIGKMKWDLPEKSTETLQESKTADES